MRIHLFKEKCPSSTFFCSKILSIRKKAVTLQQNLSECVMEATTIPVQGQILVNIEDMSMLKDIKRSISMLKGVGKVVVPRRTRLYSSYELSMRDLEEGRVYEAKDVDDLFKQCLED